MIWSHWVAKLAFFMQSNAPSFGTKFNACLLIALALVLQTYPTDALSAATPDSGDFSERDKAILSSINSFISVAIAFISGICAIMATIIYKSFETEKFDWNRAKKGLTIFSVSVIMQIGAIYVLHLEIIEEVGRTDSKMAVTETFAYTPNVIAVTGLTAIIGLALTLRALLKQGMTAPMPPKPPTRSRAQSRRQQK